MILFIAGFIVAELINIGILGYLLWQGARAEARAQAAKDDWDSVARRAWERVR